MNTEIIAIAMLFLGTVVLAYPLGGYMARVFGEERSRADVLFGPLERLLFRASGIDPTRDMRWQEHLRALLVINLVWFLWAMLVLCNQGWLPWNPDGNPSMTPDLAFNTAISFLVNCDLQHYSGESGATYFSQVFALMFLQFVSAATGIAAAVVAIKALATRQADRLGNFYDFFVKANTRILLPLCVVVALLLVGSGTPMNLAGGKDQYISMQGDTVQVSRGPAAGFVAIKHLGTNGGGYYGANSAHPLENPTYLSMMLQMVVQTIIPMAIVFMFGFFLRRRKFGWIVFGVMTIGFLLLAVPTIAEEMRGNRALAQLGIDQANGSMEGKEVRIGAAMSGYWSIVTTVISTGSVNAMHDSFTPLSGFNQLLAMMVNAFYGGCGVGFLNFFVYVILAAFIGGLMVGRTPELLGKKVEAREMKIAMLVALLHPFLILVGTAIAACLSVQGHPIAANWLNNPGFHGFSEMLYEFTSSSANNGSGFEGLGDNDLFWNISTGVVLILSRYLPIIGPVAIAGLLAEKKYIPESAGTLRPDSLTFGMLIFAIIAIIAALAFFPALTLGPLAEFFSP